MNTTKYLPSIVSLILIVLIFGCQKTKTQDARSLSESERSPQKFVPYYPDKQPSHTFRNHVEETAWQKHFDKLSPKEGMDAPDFELSDIAGKQTFKLSEYAGKQPVALIFGSFT